MACLSCLALFAGPVALGSDKTTEAQVTEPAGRFTKVFNDALQAYDAGQHARAYDLWLSIAKQGDLAAMRNLAHLLHHGMGVDANAGEAARWYSIAATRGLTSAQVNLAELFYAGDGVPQSYELAAQWYARLHAPGTPMPSTSSPP